NAAYRHSAQRSNWRQPIRPAAATCNASTRNSSRPCPEDRAQADVPTRRLATPTRGRRDHPGGPVAGAGYPAVVAPPADSARLRFSPVAGSDTVTFSGLYQMVGGARYPALV